MRVGTGVSEMTDRHPGKHISSGPGLYCPSYWRRRATEQAIS